MITDIILMAASAGLLVLLIRSFKNNPFAYRNIAVTSVIMLIVSVIIGRSSTAGVLQDDPGILKEGMISFIWQFSRTLLIPICFLCLFLCISNAVLLKKEGFRRTNFLGLMISMAYLITINILWRPLNSVPHLINGFILFLRLMLCYAECTFLSMWIIGYAVLKTEPSYDRDYVIILGCSISRKGKVRPLLKGRVNRAIRFAWDQETRTGKPIRYVPSGGQGSDEPMSEGSAMEMYLISHSAEEYEVFPEKKSRNTRENLLFSKKIIDGLTENAKVAVVTSNFHVLRSGMLARRAGFMDLSVIGSSTKWYFWPNAYFREMIAVAYMFLWVHLIVAIFFVLMVITSL